MDHDLECGVCFKSYNGGRRGPRELTCGHTFCESCLVRISRLRTQKGAAAPRRDVVCPLCRSLTSLSGDVEKMRGELQVNEALLEFLEAAGLLEQEGDDEPEPEEQEEEAPKQSRPKRIIRSTKKFVRRITTPDTDAAVYDEAHMATLRLSPWFYGM